MDVAGLSRPATVAVVNPGSSTLKLAIVGAGDAALRTTDVDRWGGEVDDAVHRAFDDLDDTDVDAYGLRVVHGGATFVEATVVDDAVEERLAALTPLAPLHQPRAVGLVDFLRTRAGARPVVACFDTQFHATIPDAAATYALPEAWRERWGLRRAGFHGLSHAWAARRALEIVGAAGRPARIVTAHLGAGASLCAVHDGVSVDTTMGFTPLEGLVMATRSGSVDPGLLMWLLDERRLDAATLADGLEHASGLAGLAGDADMRTVLARRAAGDDRAASAIAVYGHRLRREIGAMTAVLGGIDVLAFTGGIGEHAAEIRAEAVAGLAHLGLAVDPVANEDAAGDADVSASDAAARTVVVTAREDLEIARLVRALLRA